MTTKKRSELGVTPKGHRKTVGHYVDYDYIHKLSQSDKEWLSKFSDEYYGARFASSDPIHPEEYRKQIYKDNNARNRDVMCAFNMSTDRVGIIEEGGIFDIQVGELLK